MQRQAIGYLEELKNRQADAAPSAWNDQRIVMALDYLETLPLPERSRWFKDVARVAWRSSDKATKQSALLFLFGSMRQADQKRTELFESMVAQLQLLLLTLAEHGLGDFLSLAEQESDFAQAIHPWLVWVSEKVHPRAFADIGAGELERNQELKEALHSALQIMRALLQSTLTAPEWESYNQEVLELLQTYYGKAILVEEGLLQPKLVESLFASLLVIKSDYPLYESDLHAAILATLTTVLTQANFGLDPSVHLPAQQALLAAYSEARENGVDPFRVLSTLGKRGGETSLVDAPMRQLQALLMGAKQSGSTKAAGVDQRALLRDTGVVLGQVLRHLAAYYFAGDAAAVKDKERNRQIAVQIKNLVHFALSIAASDGQPHVVRNALILMQTAQIDANAFHAMLAMVDAGLRQHFDNMPAIPTSEAEGTPAFNLLRAVDATNVVALEPQVLAESWHRLTQTSSVAPTPNLPLVPGLTNAVGQMATLLGTTPIALLAPRSVAMPSFK